MAKGVSGYGSKSNDDEADLLSLAKHGDILVPSPDGIDSLKPSPVLV